MACHKKMYQWQTMQETIDDLAGKISVKKRDNESVFRQMQEITKRNEERIAQLRLTVKTAHRDLAKMLNMDHQVIQTALSKREVQLECKRYDAQTALKELNEDVCVEGKRLNHFIHQKECRNRRLDDLRLHYRDFLLLERSNFEKEDQRRARLLMTKLDKMIMKRNTASFLKSTYEKTVAKLEKDALTMHKHLDGLEVCSKAGKVELADLRKIYRSAKLGQEKSRTTRMALEQDVYRSKQDRDTKIVDIRKRAKDAAELPEFSTRAPNDILNGPGGNKKKSAYNRTTTQLEVLIPIIEQFSAVTNTVNASSIPTAYERQIVQYNILSEHAGKLDTQLNEKRKVLDAATNRLADVRYHQAEKLKARSAEIKEIREKANEIRGDTARQNEDQARLTCLMEKVRDAIQGIVEYLIPTKVEGSFDTSSMTSIDSDLNYQVDVIGDKLRKMQDYLKQPRSENNEEETTDDVTDSQVQDVRLKLKTRFTGGVRITVTNEEDASTSDNFLLDDMNLNEFYITRDEIKKYGSTAQKLKLKGKKR
jgi:hypothetical protein